MSLRDALRDFDLADLGRRLQSAAIHQDRCRRHAQRLSVPEDCPETRRAVANIDLAADALSSSERLVAAVVRFLAAEGSGRPAPIDTARGMPPVVRRPGSMFCATAVPMRAEVR
ncbi:hypothetical protein [Methylobacterium oryzisoli]|uniref:hypothetical protein n=1 Tax=Methylobacterium oryzisoli TaxID=3385502 RepID=UPI003891F3C0